MKAARQQRKAGISVVDLDEKVKNDGAAGAYEALQLYRSRATRCKSKGEFMSAITIASSGAKCLLENNYVTAGVELAMLFLDFINEFSADKTSTETDSQFFTLILEIDDRLIGTDIGTLKSEYLKGCVKWSIQTSTKEFGDPSLQVRLAEELWRLKDKSATSHFAAAENPAALCNKIIQREREQPETATKALTLGIVNFLALENIRDAFELMKLFKKAKLSTSSSKGKVDPLIQFCEYLLKISLRDAAPLFKQLVNAYASEVEFDESIPALLMGPIASRLFNIKPKVNPMMSMLQSMLA
eukprot:gene27735-36556_t